MGLSGRKVKQKIGNDPRNLTWADDAARFGMNYLAKFGWDSSKGLGASGEGIKSHLQVSQKLDMLGIGAGNPLDANGIAWKQNKDFENLLKRLNGDVVEGSGIEGFKSGGGEMRVGEERIDSKDEEKKRKGKHDSDEAPKKKKKKIDEDEEKGDALSNESANISSERGTAGSSSSDQTRTMGKLPRYRAHRARAIAAKNLSSKSATHISEILGIPTPSTTATSSKLTSGADTPQDDEPKALEIEKITISTRSVHDYFKEKLKTKKSLKLINPSAITVDHTNRDASYDTLRGGLGSSSRTAFSLSTLPSNFLTASSLPLPNDTGSQTEVAVETQAIEESPATLDTDGKIKKKKYKSTDQDKRARKKAAALVLERDEKTSEKTLDVRERRLERPLDREDESRITVDGQEPSANVATRKKKGGKRKKDKLIRY